MIYFTKQRTLTFSFVCGVLLLSLSLNPSMSYAKPSIFKSHNKLGLQHLQAGKYKKAIEEYKKALKAASKKDQAKAHGNLGYACMQFLLKSKGQKKNTCEGEEHIRQAIKLTEEKTPLSKSDKKFLGATYYNLGRFQEIRGDEQGALESYVESLDYRPNATVKKRQEKLESKLLGEQEERALINGEDLE